MFDDDSIRLDYTLADYQYEILANSIAEFEESISDDEEIAMYLTSFGQSTLMYIIKIGYSNPSLIHFHGLVNGKESQLIQHVNQLNFLLTTAPKLVPDRPAYRIGFISDKDL